MTKQIIILLLFIVNASWAQKVSINNDIVLNEFATLPYLIPVGITKANVLVELDEKVDTIGVELDSLHRIIKIEHFDLKCKIVYKLNSIIKYYEVPFPNYFLSSCHSFITKYQLGKDGYIISSTTKCYTEDTSRKNKVIELSYETVKAKNSLITSVTMVAPVQENQDSYQLIAYDKVINLMYFNYSTNSYRLIYSIDKVRNKYNFNLKSRFSRARINCIYYNYNIDKNFAGLFQTALYNVSGDRIGKLSIIKR